MSIQQQTDNLTALRDAVMAEMLKVRESEYLSSEQKYIQIEIIHAHYKQQRNHLLGIH